ncbi:MAG: polymer-forming cytoskeletal protein [Candidatus Omnitrophota bacterium]
MNKKGVALIICLIVIVILLVFSGALFSKTINDGNMVKRYVYSTEAFWLAETGIAEGIRNLPYAGSLSGQVKTDYAYSVAPLISLGNSYYQIDSTGTVTLPIGGSISESVSVVVKTSPPDPSNFIHAIETTGSLITKGQAYTITGTVNELAEFDFSVLFGVTKETMRSYATHLYNDDNFVAPVDAITWVDVDSGDLLTVAGDLQGSGILVISGDAHFSGTIDFRGIIYVIGELRLSGTPIVNGTVFAESGADIDTTIQGHVTITYDIAAINDALAYLAFLSSEVKAWRQTS